jgi:hypothetical protein
VSSPVQYLSVTCHEPCRHLLGIDDIDLDLEVFCVILHLSIGRSNVSWHMRIQANGSGRPPSSTPLPPTASKRNPFDDSSNATARRLPQSGVGAASTSSSVFSDSGRELASSRSSSSLGHWQQ